MLMNLLLAIARKSLVVLFYDIIRYQGLFHGNIHCFRSLFDVIGALHFLEVLSKLVCRDRLVAPGAYLPSVNLANMVVE
jgi:hypothetical protein